QDHPLDDLAVAGQGPVEGLLQLGGLDLGEEPELAEVDAEDRHALPGDEVDGAQHRPVATERHHEVEADGERLEVPGQVGQADGLGVGGGDADLDTGPGQAGGRPAGVGRRPLRVGDDPDGRHSPWASSTAAASSAGPIVGRSSPTRKWPRNSMLPAAPRSGDGMTASGISPSSARAAVTAVRTARWTAGSVTSPPRRTWPRPASNWGLISSTASAPSAATPARAAAARRSEMNDRSATTRSTGTPSTSASVRWRTLQRSRSLTRGSLRSDQASCPVPTSTATTEAAPRWRRQSVNPPVEAPASRARSP